VTLLADRFFGAAGLFFPAATGLAGLFATIITPPGFDVFPVNAGVIIGAIVGTPVIDFTGVATIFPDVTVETDVTLAANAPEIPVRQSARTMITVRLRFIFI
jgi:hypothetical protein